MMKHLDEFYDKRLDSIDPSEHLVQVGHTINGKAISDIQFLAMVEQIEKMLDLQPSDNLLDLCCGNGLITHKLSEKCHKILGVDFSISLIDIARKDKASPNITYATGNVKELASIFQEPIEPFTKVLMYAALQHFTLEEFKIILKSLVTITTNSPVLVFGFFPDKQKKWEFYNTPRRKWDHFIRVLNGRELITTWWKKNDLRDIAEQYGFECQFESMPTKLEQLDYRLNMKLEKRLIGE